MPIKNLADRWGGVSITLHWLTALMILGLVVVGFLMQELANSPTKMARLLWRLFAGVPQPVPGTPRWQAWASGATHGALYLVLLAMPVSGWLYNSASGFPLKWFGLFALPKLSSYDAGVKAFALGAHETLFLVLAAIVGVHALAALKHHYFDRDRTLARMLPLIKAPAPAARDQPPGA